MVIAIVIVSVFIIVADNDKIITVYDRQGNMIISSSDFDEFRKSKDAPYLDIVLSEATEILADTHDCSLDDAQKMLSKKEYIIYTNLDSQITEHLKNSCKKFGESFNIGAAITNLDGDLLAVSSVSVSKEVNFAIKESPPCSSFKPLAVYAPAIENKVITWSSMYLDSPYSKVTGSDGTQRDWPANASGEYSYKDITVAQAVRQSLNTIAVKCLSTLGVNNSIEFLEKNFSMNLDYEKSKVKSNGENEVIGNIALGSTNRGCSTVDMAGYYQIFANGGNYCEPKAINKICDSDGETIFERKKDSIQVISKETSQIVNEMLKTVVNSSDGTGRKAFCDNVITAGKTGTSENNNDNWFVGITPEYSCAIWHSSSRSNACPEIFAETINNIDHKIKLFSTSPDVTKRIYCLKTGNLAIKNCKTFDMGYYAYGTYIEKCAGDN